MAELYDGADSLLALLTGAASDGGTQKSHALSLGHYPSYTRADSLVVRPTGSLRGIVLDFVAGANGPGIGALTAIDDDVVAWTPPGGTQGPSATILNGESKVLLGGGLSIYNYVIVRRTSATALSGSLSVQLLDVINNVIGGSNFSEAESTAGAEHYRALIFENANAGEITLLKVWLDSTATNTRIAFETPTAGALTDKRSAGETSIPTGLTWSSGTTSGTGLSLASLAAGSTVGLWIERAVTPGATAAALLSTIIRYEFVLGGTTYTCALRGVNRRAATHNAYGVWYATGADPDQEAAPTETAASLPATLAGAFADGFTYHLATRLRNKYGLWGPAIVPTQVIVETGGDVLAVPPVAPENIVVTPTGDGKIIVQALYLPNTEGSTQAAIDAKRAVTWLVYVSADGTPADPATDTPVEMAMDVLDSNEPEILEWISTATYLEGTPISVLVRTRRVDDTVEDRDSANTATTETTAIYAGPVRVNGKATLGTAYAVQQAPATFTRANEFINVPNNIYWQWTEGGLKLWAGTVLVFHLRYDSSGDIPTNGFWTTFGFVQDATISGAQTGAIEMGTWSGVAKDLWIAVNGQRVMRIDVLNSVIRAAAIQAIGVPVTSRGPDPVWGMYAYSAFQVWDPNNSDYNTAMTVGTNGILRLGVGWKQRQTQAEIE